MSISINSFDLLKAVGASPQAFSDIHSLVGKSAFGLVVAQLKIKGLTVEKLRALCGAIGQTTFGLVLERMDDKAVSGLLTKVDKHHPDRGTAGASWARRHLRALAGGVQPTPAPDKPPRGPKKPPALTRETFWAESMQPRPRRKS